MKTKPVITDRFQTKHTSFVVNFEFESNVSFIVGDSGVGKSAVFSIFQEATVEDKRIRCINYLDINKNYKNTIKRSNNKLFVIDNADVLLDDKMRMYIALDGKNQYVIIGRNPSGLQLTKDEVLELDSSKQGEITEFKLRKAL